MTPCLSDTQIALFVDGKLGDPGEVLSHLDSCDGCRRLVGDLASSRGGDLASSRGGEPASSRVGADLASSRAGGPAGAAAASSDGKIGGRYTIRSMLGSGASGVVYRAFDERLAREVAVKLLRPRVAEGDARPDALLAEAHALARLAHPNVIAVYDVGTHEGQVFIAMELGAETLGSWLRQPRPWAEALRLVRQAGEGLAAAHATGIVHRDIKPENMILGSDGRSRITDFGLARAADLGPEGGAVVDGAAAVTTLTRVGGLVGTPAYMAPEQLAGQVADERSDQFAFAVVLFEALSGERPFAAATIAELRRQAGAGRVRREAARRIPRWLRRVVLRGLAADPRARWHDLRALLNAIDRGPPLNRTRVAVGASLLVGILIAAGIGVYSIGKVVRARHAAEARRNALIVLQAKAALEHDPTASLAWLKQLPRDADNWRDAVPVAKDAVSRGVAERVLRQDEGPIWSVAASPDGRHFASSVGGGAVRVWDLDGGHVELRGHTSEVTRLGYSSDGARLASAGGGQILVWDPRSSGNPLSTLSGYTGEIEGLVFSRDAAQLASTGEDGVVRLWDVAAGTARRLGDTGRRCNDVVFSPDEKLLAGACTGGLLVLWPLDGGPARTLKMSNPLARSLAFASDGGSLLVVGRGGAERLATAGGAPVPVALAGPILSLSTAPKANRMLYGTNDRGSRLAGLSPSVALAQLGGQAGAVYSVALFPDGLTAITAALDGSLRVWRLGADEARIFDAGSEVESVARSHDGRRVAAGSRDGRVRVWEGDSAPVVLAGHTGSVDWLRYLRDGRLLSLSDDGGARLWRGGEGRSLDGGKTSVNSVTVSADEKLVAWSDSEGLHLRGLDDVAIHEELALASNAELAFWRGGAQLVFAGGNETATCDPRRCGATRVVLLKSERPTQAIGASADGTRVAVSTTGGQVHVFGVDGAHRVLTGSRGDLLYLALAPDGHAVAAADMEGVVRLWELGSGAMRVLGHHGARPTAIQFSADGTSVVTGSRDETVRVWNAATGEERILRGHGAGVATVVLQGEAVVSGGADGTARVWPLHAVAPRFAGYEDLERYVAAHTTTVIDSDERATTAH